VAGGVPGRVLVESDHPTWPGRLWALSGDPHQASKALITVFYHPDLTQSGNSNLFFGEAGRIALSDLGSTIAAKIVLIHPLADDLAIGLWQFGAPFSSRQFAREAMRPRFCFGGFARPL